MNLTVYDLLLPYQPSVGYADFIAPFMGFVGAAILLARHKKMLPSWAAFGAIFFIILFIAAPVFVHYPLRDLSIMAALSAAFTGIFWLMTSPKVLRNESFRNMGTIAAVTALALFPIRHYSAQGYEGYAYKDRFETAMDEVALKIATAHTQDPNIRTPEEILAGKKDIIWYAENPHPRLGRADLGRIAWNMTGDGEPVYSQDSGKTWNIAEVRTPTLRDTSLGNGMTTVYCEYRDKVLDRSNTIMRQKTSLGDRPETRWLHDLCPQTFNPAGENLTKAEPLLTPADFKRAG